MIARPFFDHKRVGYQLNLSLTSPGYDFFSQEFLISAANHTSQVPSQSYYSESELDLYSRCINSSYGFL